MASKMAMRCGEAMAVRGVDIFSEISVRVCFFIFIYLNILYVTFNKLNMESVMESPAKRHCLLMILAWRTDAAAGLDFVNK